MSFSILSIALILFCVIHIMRTGSDRIWIYVVIFLPGLGSLAYLIAVVVPSFFRAPGTQRFASDAARRIDPGKDLRRRMDALELIDSVENRRLLAEEHLKLGHYAEAAQVYESTLTGIHQDDPALLVGFARAASGAGEHERALSALDRLRAANPDFHSSDADLIHARSLQGLGRDDEALQELESLASHATGEEARCRYAMLLRKHGRESEARSLFEEILARARRANGRYRKSEQEWIETARRELSAA